MGRAVTAISGDGDEGFSRSEAAEFDMLRHPTVFGRIALAFREVYVEHVENYRQLSSVPMHEVVSLEFSSN